MVIIRKKELEAMNDKELKEKLRQLQFELLQIKSQKASGGKNSKEIKRTISRINTRLNQRT